MTTAIAHTTRTDAAYHAMATATERLRRLEQEAASAFTEYHAARELCAAEGLTVDVTLTDGMAAAFAEWKQRRASAEARRMVQEARRA